MKVDLSPPSTPKRRFSVIIYTPSKAQKPLHGTAFESPEENIYQDNEIRDQHGVTSENRSLPRTTRRRASSTYPTRGRGLLGPDDDQMARDRKPRAQSCPARESVLPCRDARGRFARTSEVLVDNAITEKRSQPSRASSSSSVKLVQSRDSKGRFDSTNSSARAPKALRNSNQKSPVRDFSGKFARNKTANESTHVTPKRAKSRQRSSSSAIREASQQRDSFGRFAENPPEPQHVTFPVVEIPQLKPDTIHFPAVENQELKIEGPAAKKTKIKRPPAKSPFFPSPASPPKTPSKSKTKISLTKDTPSKRSPGGLVSCIPFPPLSAPHFGLIQEKLAHDPFRLLIAVTFLIRTHGKHAIPVFFELMEKYPTPESLVSADKEDIVSVIRHLGLQNSRAATYQTYAKIWLEDPPVKGKRYAVKDYPEKGSGRDILKDEILEDDDPREAWEIGHMTSGPYALDSWRIFCRDSLRGAATGWNGEGAQQDGFQPEWMRVLPEDKELRAYLRWMWLKEGFEWDPFTGEKDVASSELSKAAMEGRIAWDDKGGMRILDAVVAENAPKVQGGLGAVLIKEEILNSGDDMEDDDGLS